MANCKYCGKPAGLFKKFHVECSRVRTQAEVDICHAVSDALSDSESLADLKERIFKIGESAGMNASLIRSTVIAAWSEAVDTFLDDDILDESEERRLVELKNTLDLTQSELDVDGAYTRVVKAGVLREVLGGQPTSRVSVEGNLPINLQRGESIIWAFSGTELFEERRQRHYVGGSQGVSVRIMKGVYYRVGAFKAQPIECTARVTIDRGIFVVTNRHVYFHGSSKSFRIPYSKMVSIQPFSDGIGITKDSSNAKMQVFVTSDGWFTYNLVANMARQ